MTPADTLAALDRCLEYLRANRHKEAKAACDIASLCGVPGANAAYRYCEIYHEDVAYRILAAQRATLARQAAA